MIAIRPHDEIIDVSLSLGAAALAVTGATHALLGWVTLACVVWAIGVRVAHWPG
jgi:hypothetical protein